MRGANVCHDKRLFGNPEKSGHPRKLDIPKPFLFTDPTPPHRCSLVAFNRKRAPICLPLAINIALITPAPKYAEFKIVNNFAYKGSAVIDAVTSEMLGRLSPSASGCVWGGIGVSPGVQSTMCDWTLAP